MALINRGERGSQQVIARHRSTDRPLWRSLIAASEDRNWLAIAVITGPGQAVLSPIAANENRSSHDTAEIMIYDAQVFLGRAGLPSWFLPSEHPASVTLAGAPSSWLPRGRLASLPTSVAQLRALCRNPAAVPRPGQRSFP